MNAEIVINIQGDEPLIDPDLIDALAKALVESPQCQMATAVKKIESPVDINNPNIVKAVIDHNGIALYFSRAAIPFDRDGNGRDVYKHIGIYAYRREFLLGYKDLPASKLERIEKLEQLRALEAGYKIKTIVTDVETIGVDTPEDLKRMLEMIGSGVKPAKG
jgi:3-deoxy-manno-octulosonate cytidylyltransferase (CMP-KDO synthetase)